MTKLIFHLNVIKLLRFYIVLYMIFISFTFIISRLGKYVVKIYQIIFFM